MKKDYDDDELYFDYEVNTEEPLSPKEEKKRRKQQEALLRKKRRRKRLMAFLLCFSLLLAGVTIFLVYTRPGNKAVLRVASIYAKHTMKEDVNEEGVKAEPFSKPETIPKGFIYDDKVINVLLIGVENIGGAKHSDSMILVSENLETGKITLVSFLRDTLVDIYGQNRRAKINNAFASKGAECLINTIQETYQFYINAYAYVDFTTFEELIDTLGGVDVELSEQEAEYLNSTNYVSDEDNHNLKPGVNHMNGNQALGYCRVRYIPTLEGVNNDYGRTLRQRKVLTSLFDAYKSQSLTSLISTTNKVLGKITTNMSSGNIYTMLEGYIDHRGQELESLMIPAMKLFEGKTLDKVGAVLVIDNYRRENIDLLHESLYGKTTSDKKETVE